MEIPFLQNYTQDAAATIAAVLVFGAGAATWLRYTKKHHTQTTDQHIARELSSETPQPTAHVAAETSLLDEVEIYTAYGHLSQAAESLKRYVVQNTEDKSQSLRWLDLYVAMQDMDGLVDAVHQLQQYGVLTADDLRSTIMSCLKEHSDHDGLAHLAVEFGYISDSEIHEMRTAEYATQQTDALPHSFVQSQQNLKMVVLNREQTDAALDVDPPTIPRSHVEHLVKLESPPLLVGDEDIRGVRDEEWRSMAPFCGYIKAADLLCKDQKVADAEYLLERQSIFNPSHLILHVALLRILYHQKDIHKYAKFLLSLYLVLGDYGLPLRIKLLNYGRTMGDHPLWDALDNADGNQIILMNMASEYGVYVPNSAAYGSADPLITEKFNADAYSTEIDATDRIMLDFDSLLDYGQVDAAVDLLEKAVLAQPDHSTYYRPLLDMYDRMDAYDRFSSLTQAILNASVQPDESILLQMASLGERMQHRKRRDAA